MKAKQFLLNSKALVAAIFSAAIFFAGCKKDDAMAETTPEVSLSTEATEATASATAVRALEGYGATTLGGTGKTVYRVTNLNSSGSGSFMAALGSNRTIVFDVAGTINNFSYTGYNVTNLTIDGTTAPSPGITVSGGSSNGIAFEDGCHDIIVKNIRVRNMGNDGFAVTNGAYNIVFDHVSSSGNHDGNLDVTAGAYNVTVQYSLLGGGASDWSGNMLIAYTPTRNVSVHHNLLLSKTTGGVGERNPMVHSSNGSPGSNMMVDFRNNLVYNWGRNGGTGSGYGTGIDYEGTANVINNFYQSAAAASSAVSMDPDPTAGSGSQAYIAGNVSGNSGVNPNSGSNRAMYPITGGGVVTTQSACEAATIVRAEAGAQPLDAIDQALIAQVSLTACGTVPPSNQAPTVSAGSNNSITLPTSSVTLTGTASDPDGTISSYAWTKTSGPAATIGSPSSVSTTVSGLTAGTYVFNLRVTDNGGLTANSSVTVTVAAASGTNQNPVSNAGPDKAVTLPTNSTTLTGSATDDVQVASYYWEKVSGPSGGAITSPTSATTTITGLNVGTYVYNLRATDNVGATSNDAVNVVVSGSGTPPPINTNPISNAGADKSITLPTNSVTLNGSGTDNGGSIAGYLWEKISGPSGGSISSPNSATTNITGLNAGTYVYNLRVTDNQGATGNDGVTIVVNGVTTPPPVGYGTLLYTQLYDVSSSVNTSGGIRNTRSTSLYKTGPGSFRSEVRYADRNLNNGYRGEMAYQGTTYNPTEGVIEYDVYYQGWKNWGGGGSTILWQPTTSGASAVVGLQNYDGNFKVVRAIGSTVTQQSGTLRAVAPNTWYKMRWEVKWSSSSDGYIRLYIDNVLYYSFTGQTTDGSGTPYLKVGQNRWSITSGSNSVVHYDNLRIYQK
ncbi:MAG: heparin lyase I family protein [Chitinophagaceae bacterium]|nr:heparin lyase I family protein [Chitinophagaceae bacterium]